jgi:hypothetical protein
MRDGEYFEISQQTTITSQQVISEQAQRIRELEAQLERLQLENEQKAQIEQLPKK